MRILGELRTTDMRVLFNTYKGATAVIKFVLRINLLAQFSLVVREKQIGRPRDAEKPGRRYSRNKIKLDPL
jgi:hypothetical protein